MTDVPVRLPLPPATRQGSIYETQSAAKKSYFTTRRLNSAKRPRQRTGASISSASRQNNDKNKTGETMTEITADNAQPPRLRVIFAASIGSALEWYDFFLYGTAAALVFGELFFPKSDPVVGTLLAFLTFGVGFVVRPLGGILFGIMGDRYGRKPVLVATLLMIGVGTTLIGVLPTYAQIGIWAPILLVADARRAGTGRRRRIWRRGDLSRRECAAEPSRLLGQLCAARRVGRQSAGRRRVRAGVAVAARRPDVVGLAPAVPAQASC